MKAKTVGMLLMSAVLLIASNSNANTTKQIKKTIHLCSFAPENTLKIPEFTNKEIATGIDQASFTKVIDNVVSYYGPIVKAKGGNLTVNRKWDDSTVNASAQRSGKTWVLNMYGGLARYKGMTSDGFAMVMCHELGHHLGGFPRIASAMGSNWASNEGQSDYFAAMKCFRRIAEKDDNGTIASTLNVPEKVSAQCSLQLKTAEEIALCKRSAMTGKVLAQVLHELAGSREPKPISFDTPDLSQVSKTNDAHPAAQCRLDTYFAGAICGAAFTDDFASDNAVAGACAEERGDKLGFRSRCWFKPKL